MFKTFKYSLIDKIICKSIAKRTVSIAPIKLSHKKLTTLFEKSNKTIPSEIIAAQKTAFPFTYFMKIATRKIPKIVP